MDSRVRIKLLSRLAESETDSARAAVEKEIHSAAALLETATDYAQLELSIDILKTVGFRQSARAAGALIQFADSIEQRQLTYSEEPEMVAALRSYRSNDTLLVRATEALAVFRYQQTEEILRALLKLSSHASGTVHKAAIRGLELLSRYDLAVFYGDKERRGIGAAPQAVALQELERMDDASLRSNFAGALTVLEGTLSPEMEGTKWSYDSLTLSHSDTPPQAGIPEVRRSAISLLLRLYHLAAGISQKLNVIVTMTSVTRIGRAKPRNASREMYVENSVRVLEFFAQLVNAEHPQIVQKIEHDSFWIFFHAADDAVRNAATNVKDAVAKNADYQIYRDLVGFEGIFGEWTDLAKSDRDRDPHGADATRRERARTYASSISEPNFAEWRERILRYAQTESNDLATFPIFYHFLETFASIRSDLAFCLLTSDTEQISKFLIPLLRGLWTGKKKLEVVGLIKRWIAEGAHLYASAKLFLSNQDLDLPLLTAILQRAAELRDLSTIHQIVSVAISNFGERYPRILDELMLPGIKILTTASDAHWIFDAWFREETRLALEALDERGTATVLENLKSLDRIDYHADRILQVIAERQPKAVFTFFLERIYRERTASEGDSRQYEAIPFELHKLKEPLSRIPAFAVEATREVYDGNYGMFVYRGARLLKLVFPEFPSEFEAELVRLVREGNEHNLEFVLAVLRNFQGEPFTHPVAKEILKSIPSENPLRSEVAIALESTGVVSGEFGMVEAYERKRQEVLDWLGDPDERVRDFAKWYIAGLERMRDAERVRAEEDIALRKFQYRE